MKKLFVTLMIVAGLMFGGCAGSMMNQTGMQPDVKSMPSVEYQALDFFDDGKPYYVPNHIRALEPIWYPSSERLTDSIMLIHFSMAEEKITFVVDDKKMIILALLYGYGEAGIDEAIMEFYIYDGKPYPVKVTDREMETYINIQKEQETT